MKSKTKAIGVPFAWLFAQSKLKFLSKIDMRKT